MLFFRKEKKKILFLSGIIASKYKVCLKPTRLPQSDFDCARPSTVIPRVCLKGTLLLMKLIFSTQKVSGYLLKMVDLAFSIKTDA